MELNRRSLMVYGLLAAVWLLVTVWQAEEHARVRGAAKADLSTRSRDIANTVSACIRGMRFRGAVWQQRLEPLLNELVNGRTNELVKSSELLSIALLNAAGETIAAAGRPIDFQQRDILQQGVRWGQHSVTFINPVDLGASLTSEGGTNPTVVLPPPHDFTNTFRDGRPFTAREAAPSALDEPPPNHAPPAGPPPGGPPPGEPPPEEAGNVHTNPAESTEAGARPDHEHRPRGEFRPRRPPWLRGMDEKEFQSLVEKQTLHGLVLAMSTDSLQVAVGRDLWLRAMIELLATVSVLGCGLAWRSLARSSELEIRLVRASELNTHLREMNLAAAGLAHETRNPLNIIRGLAQMISKQADATTEIRQKSLEMVNEADKVAAQLNEFINYSRPREVRRSAVTLGSVINEVVRALGYDLEEKKLGLQIQGEPMVVEADEQMLRQALFNLLLNAIQAVAGGGQIQVAVERRANEGAIEVRDDGPGVPPERRTEIFKPYFTTQAKGTGLGLAVVQQIVLAHGWEIECLPNQPRGAAFRISHLKVAGV